MPVVANGQLANVSYLILKTPIFLAMHYCLAKSNCTHPFLSGILTPVLANGWHSQGLVDAIRRSMRSTTTTHFTLLALFSEKIHLLQLQPKYIGLTNLRSCWSASPNAVWNIYHVRYMVYWVILRYMYILIYWDIYCVRYMPGLLLVP